MSPLGVYIHIPYCVRKCPYCDFNSYGVGTSEPARAEAYTDAVKRELSSYFANGRHRDVSTVFFGGGTPSLLSPKNIKLILDEIPISGPSVEITLEANPGTVQEQVGKEKLAGFLDAGVNRISFGSQSFSERKLSLLGRLHSGVDIENALLAAREVGFKRINLDLIFGTKDETLEEWSEDLQRALTLDPEHLSVYGLTIEPGTEFGRLARRGISMNLEDDFQADQFILAQERLSRGGFRQYEISNYAKAGEECRHNLGYWKRRSYLGVGAGAHGFLLSEDAPWGLRTRNIPGPDGYIAKVSESGFGTINEELLTSEDAELEYLSLALRTGDGVCDADYKNLFQQSFREKYRVQLAELESAECLKLEAEAVRPTPKGFRLLNSVLDRLLS